MRFGNGQVLKSLVLFVFLEAHARVKGSSGFVERIPGKAAMPTRCLPNPAPTHIERVSGQADVVEGIHDGDGVE